MFFKKKRNKEITGLSPRLFVDMNDVFVKATLEQNRSSKDENKVLDVLVGVDRDGNPILKELKNLPSLLITGFIGTGRTVELSQILSFLLHSHLPRELKILPYTLEDVEFHHMNNSPYLYSKVFTDLDGLYRFCEEVLSLLEEREWLIKDGGYSDISEYNQNTTSDNLPTIVVVVDHICAVPSDRKKSYLLEAMLRKVNTIGTMVGVHVIATDFYGKPESFEQVGLSPDFQFHSYITYHTVPENAALSLRDTNAKAYVSELEFKDEFLMKWGKEPIMKGFTVWIPYEALSNFFSGKQIGLSGARIINREKKKCQKQAD